MTFHERAREKHDDHGYTPTKNVSLGESEKQMKEQQPEEKSDKTKAESAAEQDIVGATQAESSVSVVLTYQSNGGDNRLCAFAIHHKRTWCLDAAIHS